MMNRSMFPMDIFDELDSLQRDMLQAFNIGTSIRGIGRGGFPALNVGSTEGSVELYAFAPGLDPNSIEVNLERGALSITGERGAELPAEGNGDGATVHLNERFAGRFRRVLSLPEDVDPDKVSAEYREGVLHISVQRAESAKPRRILLQ
jgi:HSP20 family protein